MQPRPPQYPQWQRGPDGRWYLPRPPQQYIPPPGYRYPPPQPPYQPPPVYINQSVQVVHAHARQHLFFWRLLYFLFIGWWLGLLWMTIALVCMVTILGIPVGVLMLNMLPSVLTLQRH